MGAVLVVPQDADGRMSGQPRPTKEQRSASGDRYRSQAGMPPTSELRHAAGAMESDFFSASRRFCGHSFAMVSSHQGRKSPGELI